MNRRVLLRYGGFAFSVSGAKLAGIAISSLTFPFLVRHLGVKMYGLWNYVVAIGGFLETIADPGITVFFTQQLAAKREEAFELMPDVFVLRLVGTLVAAAIAWSLSYFEVRPDIRQLMRFYLLGFFALNLIASDFVLGALEMFHSRSILTILQQTLFAAGIFTLVWKPDDVIWVPSCVLASSALTSIIGWIILYRRGFRVPLEVHINQWRVIVVPSSHYGLSSLMSSFYHRTGPFVVRWLLGDYALGIYAAATRLLDILRNFVMMSIGVLMPKIARTARTGADLIRLTRVSTLMAALVSFPLCAGLFITTNVVVPLLLGPKYTEDVALLKWMSPYIVTASAASLLAGTLLYAMGKHRAYLLSTCTGAIGGVSLYLALTPTLGLKGAGLAFVLAEACVATVAYHFLPTDLHDCWKTPNIPKAVVAVLIMTLAVEIVKLYRPEALIVILTGAVVYLSACAWLMRKSLAEEFRVAQ